MPVVQGEEMIGAGPDFREEEFNWREGGVSVSGVARLKVESVEGALIERMREKAREARARRAT